MQSWGMDLAEQRRQALSRASATPLPYIVLVLHRGGDRLRPAEADPGRNPQSAGQPAAADAAEDHAGVLRRSSRSALPAGVVLYFLVSNLYRIGQQAFITRTMYADGGILSTTATEDRSSGKTKSQPAPERKGILGALGLGAGSPDHRTPAQGQGAGAKNRVPAKSKAKPKTKQRNSKGATKTGTGRRPAKPTPTTTLEARSPACHQSRSRRRPSRPSPPIGEPTSGRRASGGSGSERTANAQGRRRPSRQPPAPVNRPALQEEEEVSPVEWVETTGRTVEEAKDAALDQLGVDEQEAEFEVLEEPTRRPVRAIRGRGPGPGPGRAQAAAAEGRTQREVAAARPDRVGRRTGRAGKAAGRGRGQHRSAPPPADAAGSGAARGPRGADRRPGRQRRARPSAQLRSLDQRGVIAELSPNSTGSSARRPANAAAMPTRKATPWTKRWPPSRSRPRW